MWSLTRWTPGCWSAAVLKICDQRIIPQRNEEDFRYPEQWMFVLWRPTTESRPLGRPDAWGLTIGHPEQELLKLAEGVGSIYLLQDDECLWSSWLAIAQVGGGHEPWLTSAVDQCIAAQRAEERARYVQWYGSEDAQFNQFLRRVLTQP